jgi:hypothetical protein
MAIVKWKKPLTLGAPPANWTGIPAPPYWEQTGLPWPPTGAFPAKAPDLWKATGLPWPPPAPPGWPADWPWPLPLPPPPGGALPPPPVPSLPTKPPATASSGSDNTPLVLGGFVALVGLLWLLMR